MKGNKDGLGSNSTFSQPTGLCCEGNTIITVDSDAKTVCIITSPRAIAKYLKNIQELFKAFSVHSDILGDGHSNDIKQCISNLGKIEQFLTEMSMQAKRLLNLT